MKTIQIQFKTSVPDSVSGAELQAWAEYVLTERGSLDPDNPLDGRGPEPHDGSITYKTIGESDHARWQARDARNAMSDSFRRALVDELKLWETRLAFNKDMASVPNLVDHLEHYVIARVQQAAVNRLQLLLSRYDEASTNTIPDQEEVKMGNTVKSLAGTGKDYCQFTIEVSGGAWGAPQTISLVEGGGCGGTKLVPLTKFALPVAGVPAGRYTIQAKLTGGGCGEPKGAHVQFKFPAGIPAAAASQGNRAYGWAFETTSPELAARLG